MNASRRNVSSDASESPAATRCNLKLLQVFLVNLNLGPARGQTRARHAPGPSNRSRVTSKASRLNRTSE